MNSAEPEWVRPPAVAGRFYPHEAAVLSKLVSSLLAEAPPGKGPVPKALVAPHAGYVYSGPIAASAYSQLSPGRDTLKRIILLGPAHYANFEDLATSSANAFETPLGLVPVDGEAVHRLCSLPSVAIRDEAHAAEHSLEVQLPFLQIVLRDFFIVPLLVGNTDAQAVDQVLEAVWGGPETCLVISSDLSHYHDFQTAKELDQLTAAAVVALKPEDIASNQACGRSPLRGLLQAARRHQLRGCLLDLRNSGDTAGPRDRVVGYGAFAFHSASS